MVRVLAQNDYEAWIELAREVEPLFGPMTDSEEFLSGIKACIDSGDAYGIEHQNGKLAGIIALDRNANEILWLAVGNRYRGNGYGNSLVLKAIEELEKHGDIRVQTFCDQIKEGKSARIIYQRHGFVDLEKAGKNPAGIETVIMVRKSSFSG